MALESKPLFHTEVLRQQVRAFNLPERVEDWQPKLQHWAELISSGRADDFKETALLPDFLTDIFCGLLGYTGPVGLADTHNSHLRLIDITSGQQQTQRTLLDWLLVEYAIEKPGNKLLAVTDLDSDTWVGEVERIRSKKLPLTAAGAQGLRDRITESRPGPVRCLR